MNTSEEAILLTQEGLQKLQQELEGLKTTRRKEVAERLKEAISYGDLSENAEYEEAKNEQAFVEGRIVEIEKMIKNVKVIDEEEAHKAQNVQIGTTVELLEVATKEEMTLTIVGSTEASPLEQKISNESPLGQSLLGRKKGDVFTIQAPGGTFEYKVKKLS